MLTRNHKSKRIVGLDIEASSIAATELELNGGVRVGGYGVGPLDAGVFREGEVQEPDELAAALKDLFTGNKLARNVRLGVANQRVIVRALRVPPIENPDELATAIRFQAQDHIPMPLDQAVLDWQIIPPQPGIESRDLEVVVVAARRDMLMRAMEAVEGAGLRLVGIDHSAFGLIRALQRETPGGHRPGSSTRARHSTRWAKPTGRWRPCRRRRPEPADRQRRASRHRVPEPRRYPRRPRVLQPRGRHQHRRHPRRVLRLHPRHQLRGRGHGPGARRARRPGARPRSKLADPRRPRDPRGIDRGRPRDRRQAREALASGTKKLGDELRRSLEYYGALERAVRVESMVVAGAGTTIPGLVDGLRDQLPLPIGAVTPGALSGVAGTDAARLTLSYGLGLEE